MNHLQNAGFGETRKLLNIQLGGERHGTIEIQPGTTPRDVLHHLGLGDDYEVCAGNFQLRPGESLWGKVQDGDCAYVSAKVDAGLAI